jgi:hypothetical protein
MGTTGFLLLIAILVIGGMSLKVRATKKLYRQDNWENKIRLMFAQIVNKAMIGETDGYKEYRQLKFSGVEEAGHDYEKRYGYGLEYLIGCPDWEVIKNHLTLIYAVNSARQCLRAMRDRAGDGDVSSLFEHFQGNIKLAVNYSCVSETMLKDPSCFEVEINGLQQTGYASQAQYFIGKAERQLKALTEPCNQALAFAGKAGITIDKLGITEQSDPIMWHLLHALAAASSAQSEV